jgi:hypothetical protein
MALEAARKRRGWRSQLPMVAAAAVFAGLSLMTRWGPAPVVWVLTRPVAPGAPVTRQDLKAVVQPLSVPPDGFAGRVARVPLVAGQTLVPGDLEGRQPSGAEMTLPLSGAETVGVAPGDVIQLAEAGNRATWVSPRLQVVAVAGGASPSVVVSAPLAVLTRLLPHAGSAWIIVDPTGGGS